MSSLSLVKGGATRSRVDHRDYVAEGIFHEEKLAGSPFLKPDMPAELFLFDDEKLRMGGNGVYNQGATFKCVPYVVCTIREKQVRDESLAAKAAGMAQTGYDSEGNLVTMVTDKITFSKDYIYDMRENSFTDGMSGADAMRIVATHGFVEDQEYEHYLTLYNSLADLERQKRTLPDGAEYSAKHAEIDRKIHDEQTKMSALIYRLKPDPLQPGKDVYARVTTVNGLKQSLLHNGPCLIILPFYGNPQIVNFWLPPDGNSVDEMGHAVTVVGYSDNEQSFYLRNTWGPTWNGTGHVWFPYSHLKLAWETWTIFPKGTDHLIYHKKRSGASIAPSLAPSLRTSPEFTDTIASTLASLMHGSDYAGCPQGFVGGSAAKKSKKKEKQKSRVPLSRLPSSKLLSSKYSSSKLSSSKSPVSASSSSKLSESSSSKSSATVALAISVLKKMMSDEKSIKRLKRILENICKEL